MSIITKKICIIGEADINPHRLIHRSVDYQFGEKYLSSLGVTISKKTLEIPGVKPPEQLKLQLIIWNVIGSTKYQTLTSSYLRGSSGAVIAADFSCPETIKRLPEYIQLFLAVNPKAFIILALHQSDLVVHENLIQLKDFERVSRIYPTSVETGLYGEELFQQIANKILESCDNTYPLFHPNPERGNSCHFLPLTRESSGG